MASVVPDTAIATVSGTTLGRSVQVTRPTSPTILLPGKLATGRGEHSPVGNEANSVRSANLAAQYHRR
jgi:hypothetical protein